MIVLKHYGAKFLMSNPLAKLNIFRILKDHISTLKDYGKNKLSFFDLLTFFLLPAIVSSLLVNFDIRLSTEFSTLLITAFSIFAGLLFNLLVLVFDVIGKVSSTEKLPVSLSSQQSLDRRISILESVSFNISFEILLCLFGVLLLSISTLFQNNFVQVVSSILSFYVVILFALTLAMILRRVHGLLNDEIRIQREIIKALRNQ